MFRAFCRFWFRFRGWGFEGSLPDLKQYLVVVGPHTSSWDFIYGVAARDILKTDIKFIGKRELFKFPFKKFFLKLGGYPVNRRQKEKAVETIARLFAENERFILALSPEGTRGKVEELRSGFYHIARLAGIPYVLVGMDYGHKKIVISEPSKPAGQLEVDLDRVRQFLSDITGKNPHLGVLR